MYKNSFAKECKRKDMLLNLFELLENEERKRKKAQKNEQKYDRIFKGWAQVKNISHQHAELERDNGEIIRPLVINAEIGSFLQIGDDLMISAGRRGNHWFVLSVQMIGSHLIPDELLNGQEIH